MQRVVSNYCLSKKKNNLKNIKELCFENLGNELLKINLYKLRLNENIKNCIYQTKMHKGFIPSNVVRDQKCIVVSDGLLYILRGM